MLLMTKSTNWSIGVHRSHPTQRALPMAPLVHCHQLQPSGITSPPSATSPMLSPVFLLFIGQSPSSYSRADATGVAVVSLHPSNYCSTTDCCAWCFLHASCPSRLSCCHHPSRLHWPISHYLGILSCWRSLGQHPIHPSSWFSSGGFSSCLIINGKLPDVGSFPPILPKLWIRQNTKNIASNALKVTGVVFSDLPPIFNALGALRCTYRASLNIPVSL